MTGGTIVMLVLIVIIFFGGTGMLLARSINKPDLPEEEEK